MFVCMLDLSFVCIDFVFCAWGLYFRSGARCISILLHYTLRCQCPSQCPLLQSRGWCKRTKLASYRSTTQWQENLSSKNESCCFLNRGKAKFQWRLSECSKAAWAGLPDNYVPDGDATRSSKVAPVGCRLATMALKEVKLSLSQHFKFTFKFIVRNFFLH